MKHITIHKLLNISWNVREYAFPITGPIFSPSVQRTIAITLLVLCLM